MEGNRLFGDFLRSRRMRLAPDTSGGAARQRRRTPGLKREEVAQRAGISAEWYVKLEQGRAVSPSVETVEALGQALRLDGVELAHLRSLAAAGGRQLFRREAVPASLSRIVESLPEPAYLTGQRWDILSWNDATAALFGNFGQLPLDDRKSCTGCSRIRLPGAYSARPGQRRRSAWYRCSVRSMTFGPATRPSLTS
jgi:transcriptional regulator with XRE-family HTH domain